MLRMIAGIAAMVISSAAWGQVVYPPAPQARIYNPYYDKLTPQGVARLRVLGECHGAGYLPLLGPFRQLTGLYDQWGNPIIAEYSPLDLGIDPQTGQPLYFRKADLLPPEKPEAEEKCCCAEKAPTTRPTNRPEIPGAYPPGTIIIKPYKPKGSASQVSR